jgi:AraC-like DNA-binding protein
MGIVTPIENSSTVMTADMFVFLPVGTRVYYRAIESGTAILLRMGNMVGKIPECSTFRFQRSVGTVQFEEVRGLYPLQANARIKNTLQGIMDAERDGFKCALYAELIAGQLLFQIQVYYRQEEYSRFYATILSPDAQFSDFVYANWRNYPTIKEMTEAANMTTQQFANRFRSVFGEAPCGWLKRRKAEAIYYDICSSEKALKAIAQEHGFSMPNFIRYCRYNYSMTPGAIRNRLESELGCASCEAMQSVGVNC